MWFHDKIEDLRKRKNKQLSEPNPTKPIILSRSVLSGYKKNKCIFIYSIRKLVVQAGKLVNLHHIQNPKNFFSI